jgi:hypothetical protein
MPENNCYFLNSKSTDLNSDGAMDGWFAPNQMSDGSRVFVNNQFGMLKAVDLVKVPTSLSLHDCQGLALSAVSPDPQTLKCSPNPEGNRNMPVPSVPQTLSYLNGARCTAKCNGQ